MKILALNGSPRKGGNTDILVDAILMSYLDGFPRDIEAEKIYLNDFNIAPCQDCENKRGDGGCIIDDDMQKLYLEVLKSDIVVLATPIYFGSVSAQTKCMIDRWQCYWLKMMSDGNKSVNGDGKKGIVVLVSAQNKDKYFENAKQIAKNFFATIGADYAEEVICPHLDEKGVVVNHPECLEKVKNLATRRKK